MTFGAPKVPPQGLRVRCEARFALQWPPNPAPLHSSDPLDFDASRLSGALDYREKGEINLSEDRVVAPKFRYSLPSS